jgi:hypothetical protein
MSIALTNTQNTMGVRTLHGTANLIPHQQVRRLLPAAPLPGPRAAESPVHPTLHGMGAVQYYESDGLVHAVGPARVIEQIRPVQATTNPNGTGSQVPTGVIYNPISVYNAGVAEAVPTDTNVSPTTIAQIQPASQPGYLVVTSGGGTAAQAPSSTQAAAAATTPDYVSEITAYLSQSTLISAVPNWVTLAGLTFLGLMLLRGKK